MSNVRRSSSAQVLASIASPGKDLLAQLFVKCDNDRFGQPITEVGELGMVVVGRLDAHGSEALKR